MTSVLFVTDTHVGAGLAVTVLLGCGSASGAGGDHLGGTPDDGDAIADSSGAGGMDVSQDVGRGSGGGVIPDTSGANGAGGSVNGDGGGGTGGMGGVDGEGGVGAIVLVGAGDIADCGTNGASSTASLLDDISGTVFTAGDNAYPEASAQNFAQCYEPTWGRHKARTMPAAGNHEYHTPGAAPYFAYFGTKAGDPSKGYYSYDAGLWHVVVVNSNCVEIGGCSAGTPQEQWLRTDLATHPAACTLAYWHHALFASGQQGSNPIMLDIWKALYEFGVDVVLNGHDHDYERFAPQNPLGAADAAYGIREFIVGTGGAPLYPFGTVKANSEKRDNSAYGVFKLTLRDRSYDWQFVPQVGKTFTDAGTAQCHGAPRK
jgi:hypothetical protein